MIKYYYFYYLLNKFNLLYKILNVCQIINYLKLQIIYYSGKHIYQIKIIIIIYNHKQRNYKNN
jgi:hypothetical protein